MRTIARSPQLPRLPLAVALTAVAGFVDAVGYLHFAHVFVSFMSGNSTVLGIALGRGAGSGARAPLVAIGCFVLGAFIGFLIRGSESAWRTPLVLSLESILLVLALVASAAGRDPAVAIAPLAAAMGAQNAVVREVGGVRIALTYITGALVNLGQSLAHLLLARGTRTSAWHVHAGVWIALIAGGTGGGFAYTRTGFRALIVPIVVLGTIAIMEYALVAAHRRSTPRR